MGLASHAAEGEAVSTIATSYSTSSPPLGSHPSNENHREGFDAFATTLRRDLGAVSRLEEVLADRVILAAWRLDLASRDEIDAARSEGDLLPLSSRTLCAERSLETALELLDVVRNARPRVWGRADYPALNMATPKDDVDDDGLDDPLYSNEWPTMPGNRTGSPKHDHDVDEPAALADDETVVPTRWQDRLIFDFKVSETSPVVKGTWVTVGHVVSLIVDGWTWSDILRTHPELTEDDIRTCLAYAVEQDNVGEY